MCESHTKIKLPRDLQRKIAVAYFRTLTGQNYIEAHLQNTSKKRKNVCTLHRWGPLGHLHASENIRRLNESDL